MAAPFTMTETERKIAAAQGYIVLGLYPEARDQIDALPQELTKRTDVIELRVLCNMGQQQWGDALIDALWLCSQEQHEPGGYIHAAYCLHELGRTKEALKLLSAGPASLRKKAVYFYNLGCYSAKLGKIQEALKFLEKAFARDPALRRSARKDPDLISLREQLS
jgi:tetratricopeptide (TPR) repeat protein